MSSPVPTQPTRFGQYWLFQRLGFGGMAEIWTAKRIGPGGFERKLVIKRILAHLADSPEFVRMFMNEARISAHLDHPNIVQVIDFGAVDGQYFLAMEHVRGKDLARVLAAFQKRGAFIPYGLAALVARDVARALAYAHALRADGGAPLNIVHRDISPSNVMIAYTGAVKLLDFGIAKAMAEVSTTRAGAVKGKYSYMSPEQEKGGDIDLRSDIFSLGVTLYEMLTGRRFTRGALLAEGSLEPPSLANPAVPPALDEICRQALAHARDERHASARELMERLDEVVHATKTKPEQLAAMMSELFPEPAGTVSLLFEGLPSDEPARATPRGEPYAGEAELAAPAWRRRMQRALVIGGVALGTAALLLGWVRATRAPSASLPLRAPPAPASAEIEVQSDPPGAQVFLGDEPAARGVTPLHLSLARSTVAVRVALKQAQYADRSVSLTPDHDAQLHVALEPLPPPPPAVRPAPPPARKKTPPRPPRTVEPVRKPIIVNDGMVNPFK
jgi:serine/threonine-protein kinase